MARMDQSIGWANLDGITYLANILGETEFELFRRAYRAWHGRWPDEIQVERDFGNWLTERADLPPYVRGYLRQPHFIYA